MLGISFGKKSGKSSTNLSKTEDTTQKQTANTNSTQQNTSSTQQNSSSQGTSTSTQSGTQTSTSGRTSDMVSGTNLFSSDVLGSLEDRVKTLLGATGPAALSGSTFDPNQFVADTVGAAEAKSRDFLDQTKSAIGDMIGAGTDNSSMGTLLLARQRANEDANLAGVRGQATQTAAGIVNAQDQLALAQSGQGIDLLTQLLGSLKGGASTSTQTGSEATTGTTQNSQTGTTNTSESSSQNSNTQATQTIQQLVEALLSGTTKTTGTESTKSSGMDIGANLSLGGK